MTEQHPALRRPSDADHAFRSIVERAARLICTTRDFERVPLP